MPRRRSRAHPLRAAAVALGLSLSAAPLWAASPALCLAHSGLSCVDPSLRGAASELSRAAELSGSDRARQAASAGLRALLAEGGCFSHAALRAGGPALEIETTRSAAGSVAYLLPESFSGVELHTDERSVEPCP